MSGQPSKIAATCSRTGFALGALARRVVLEDHVGACIAMIASTSWAFHASL
jgi:hypothetical protein